MKAKAVKFSTWFRQQFGKLPDPARKRKLEYAREGLRQRVYELDKAIAHEARLEELWRGASYARDVKFEGG